MSHARFTAPPKPIRPGYYCVQYRNRGDPVIKIVHMWLERYGYRSRLLDFCDLNDCRIFTLRRIDNLKEDLKWTRTE